MIYAIIRKALNDQTHSSKHSDLEELTQSNYLKFGIKDELVRDDDPNSPWTGNINSMKTRGVFINFTFQ